MLDALYCIFSWFVLFTAWTVIAMRWFELKRLKSIELSFIAIVCATGFALGVYNVVTAGSSTLVAVVVALLSFIIGNTQIRKGMDGLVTGSRKRGDLFVGIAISAAVIAMVMFVKRLISQ